MPHPALRVLACLALAMASFTGADPAGASVGDMSGGALSSFAHVSPVQTVQSDECWEENGPDGPGYYPCGDGFGGGGPVIGPAVRLHRRHGVVVAHPHAANRSYSGASSGRVGAGGGFPSAGPHFGAATVTPGSAGSGGFHGLGGAGNFHGVGLGVPHIGAPVSPGVTGGVGGFHAAVGVGAPHIGAPASSGVGGGFHARGGAPVFSGHVGGAR